MKTRRTAKKESPRCAPTFWWKFNGPNLDVIVQSDWPGGRELARFKAAAGVVGRDAQIEQAELLIADFKAGRKTPQWART